jgi:hypothetical protein
MDHLDYLYLQIDNIGDRLCAAGQTGTAMLPILGMYLPVTDLTDLHLD